MRQEILDIVEDIEDSADETFAECKLVRTELMPKLRNYINNLEVELEDKENTIVDLENDLEGLSSDNSATIEDLFTRVGQLEDEVFELEQK